MGDVVAAWPQIYYGDYIDHNNGAWVGTVWMMILSFALKYPQDN